MASKINSASEVNTGFLSSVSIPNLRQGLLEHFFECSHESEDDSSDSDVCSSIFFGQIQSRRLVKHVVRGITQWSRQYLLNVSQRSDMGNQRIQNDSKKGENIFLPKYDCIRHFDLSLMLCCTLHVTFISYKITYILQNENIFI